MEELFEKLKSEPPINNQLISKTFSDDTPTSSGISSEPVEGIAALRRESMPPPSSTYLKTTSKCRSLSPPKNLQKTGSHKSVKVCLPRKKNDPPKASNNENTSNDQSNTNEEETSFACESVYGEKIAKFLQEEEAEAIEKSRVKKNAELKKSTPTKAQQKLFDPDVEKKAASLADFKLKRVRVRLQRQSLEELQKKFEEEAKHKKKAKQQIWDKAKTNEAKKTKGRSPSSAQVSPEGPVPKKQRLKNNSIEEKPKKGFFIKLSPSKKIKDLSDVKNSSNIKEKTIKSGGVLKQKKKLNSPLTNPNSSKPTKFSRTKLISTFGSHFFRCHVKIERCKHPLMLIFESNAKARKLQAKQNKEKNLTVSFKEQVEILGSFSGTDSDESNDSGADQASASHVTHTEDIVANGADTSDVTSINPNPIPAVMPARLKKVENGKVIDDIELDTSLFIDPNTKNPSSSSTPITHTPSRKKRQKKTYSPLKGDGASSERKEQLKLANEKLPSSGLRDLHIEDADDDDDDEYIVPIEIPPRRNSRMNSSQHTEAAIHLNDTTTSTSPIHNLDTETKVDDLAASIGSSGSFVSAEETVNAIQKSAIDDSIAQKNDVTETEDTAHSRSCTPTNADINPAVDDEEYIIKSGETLINTEGPSSVPTVSARMLDDSIINQTNEIEPMDIASDNCIMTTVDTNDADISMELLAEAHSLIDGELCGVESGINALQDVEMLESPKLTSVELDLPTPTLSPSIDSVVVTTE